MSGYTLPYHFGLVLVYKLIISRAALFNSPGSVAKVNIQKKIASRLSIYSRLGFRFLLVYFSRMEVIKEF